MEMQKYINDQGVQKNILIGIILILTVALISLFVILNLQFNSKLVQIENAAMVNNQRLTAINNFLLEIDQQLRTAASQQQFMQAMSNLDMSSAETK